MADQKQKNVSLHDVAEAAGVSVSTVSRALSLSDRINAKTQARILDVAQTLGYHPNIAARNLRLGQPRTILAVMPHHKETVITTLVGDAQVGIEAAIREPGYALNVVNMRDRDQTANHVLDLVYGRQVSGAIIFAEKPIELNGRGLIEAGLPIVSLTEDLTHLGITSVVSSDRQSMVEAIEMLASLGHRSFFFISGPQASYHSRQREAGVRSGLIRQFGSDEALIKYRGGFEVESGCEAARHYLSLEDRPTAVICWADEVALGFQSVVLESGLRIPDDVSLVSFDGLAALRYVRPSISTFDQNMRNLGACAARLLIEMIDNGAQDEAALIEYPARMFEGRSVGAPAPRQG